MDTKKKSTEETSSKVRMITVTDEHVGRRLDNFLQSNLKNVPKSLIYKIIRDGQVRINSGRKKPTYRLCPQDKVRIPPVHVKSNLKSEIPQKRLTEIGQSIIFENEHYLVVDKPSGLASHGGTGVHYGVIEVLRQLRPYSTRLDLAHRLDKETSGCLLIAKSLRALRSFQLANNENKVTKRYKALLMGQVPSSLKKIQSNLDISRGSSGHRQARVSGHGKYACTIIEKKMPYGSHTLAFLKLETGRMHQIRAHCLHVGFPIAGDREYGDVDFNVCMRKCGLTRLFLHSFHLSFKTELGLVDVTTKLPDELTQVLLKIDTLGSTENLARYDD
jgi:23S rRNA pseudouridine955/2504/2580 synthase